MKILLTAITAALLMGCSNTLTKPEDKVAIKACNSNYEIVNSKGKATKVRCNANGDFWVITSKIVRNPTMTEAEHKVARELCDSDYIRIRESGRGHHIRCENDFSRVIVKTVKVTAIKEN